MRKFIISLLLSLASLIGMAQGFKGAFSKSTNNLFQLYNPSKTHTWREDGNGNDYDYTARIYPPAGYKITSWTILERLDSTTTSTFDTGSGEYIHEGSLAYHGSSLNAYDIMVTATTSIGGLPATIQGAWPTEFFVLPAEFTEGQADLVIDVSVYGISNINGAWTDRSSGGAYYKVYVKNAYSGASSFIPFYWRADNDRWPVIFQFHGVTISSTIKEFQPGSNRNVIFDGTSGDLPDGLKLRKLPGGTAENAYVNGADGTHESDGLTFCGIDIDNGSSNQGGSGFVVNTSGSAAFNYSNYTLDKIIVWCLKVRRTRDECLYLAHFDDYPHPTYVYSPVTNAIYAWMDIGECGNECLQIGTHWGTDVLKSTFYDCGVRNQELHRNGFQPAHGNRGLAIYMNRFDVNRKCFEWYTGQHGNVVEVFSNVFTNTGVGLLSSDVGNPAFNGLLRFDQSVDFTTEYSGFFQNTVVTNSGKLFDFYLGTGSPTTIYNKFVFANNLITTDISTPHYAVFNSFSSGWLTENNLQYTSTATPQFINVSRRNYHLAITSPAFTTKQAAWPKLRHRLVGYDFDGIGWVAGHDAYGAFSGYENFDH